MNSLMEMARDFFRLGSILDRSYRGKDRQEANRGKKIKAVKRRRRMNRIAADSRRRNRRAA